MALRLCIRTMTAIVALTMMACSEHVPAGPDPGDQAPPSIITAVAWDVNHVVVVFDEPVTRWSADNPGHYHIAGSGFSSSPALPIAAMSVSNVFAASRHGDYRTVTLTTAAMLDEPYMVMVTGVSDTHGNAIVRTAQREFVGTKVSDTTPPEVVYRHPQSDATGISTGTVVTVGFSEAVPSNTIFRGLRVRGEGARLVSIRYEDLLHYTCAVDSLQPDTRYTVSLTGVEDLAGNTMPDMQWTFETQKSYDTTAPSVVSSWPAKNALHVDVHTDLSLTFSEPMDPYSVILRPPVRTDAMQWSNGGRKVKYETEWIPGRQYTVQVRPGEMRDPAGNGSTQLFTLTFSTGEALETGSFAGTITGDPRSTRAGDPTGGLVFAGVTSPDDLYTSVVGIVGENDAYAISQLRNASYFPFYVKDSDGNRIYQPKYGDAIGVYGVSDWFAAEEPQTVEVADARITGIDFRVYDPTAVYGLLSYDGPRSGSIRVGLFRTDGFDPLTSAPVVGITSASDGVWDYVINSLDTGPFPDGEYYVVAFLDSDGNGVFDPSQDPMGVYGDSTPIAVDLSRGNDAPGASIKLQDPAAFANAAAVGWPNATRSMLLQRVAELVSAWTEP